ncbi:MAG TPA: carboxypeptidase-like regulatory domain-containing protein, partial [bacterium]|nr:carboxypeptidase-like regulatory domain-containing protein [bacterium]
YLSALAGDGYAAYADELAAGVVPTLPRAGGTGIGAASIYEGREAAALAAVKSRWGQGFAENAVSGRVVSDEGTPVAGAVVGVGPLAAVTDRDGRYELHYVPRGRSLTAEAPGYERAGTSGAGGRGDFYMKQILRRVVLNDGGPAVDYAAKGYEDDGVALDGNAVGGPAFVGRLKGKSVGRFAFKPALRDWRTFGAFAVELYNGFDGCVQATVRLEDDAGAFYEEIFLLPPRGWLPARVELGLAGERYYVKALGAGGNLRFDTKPKLDFSLVKDVEISFDGPAGAEVRVGRAWLEARKE